MTGIAGRRAVVKVTGAPVAFTAAATSTSDNLSYQITNTARRIWDRTATITVLDGGIATAEAYTVNRLTGTITFGTTGTRVITVTGSYLPVSSAAGARSYSWSIEATPVDVTDYDSANTNGGFTSCEIGLHKVSGSIGRNWTTDSYFSDALMAGAPVVLEFFSDRTAAADLICWAILDKDGIQAALEGRVDADVSFVGTTDADGRCVSSVL